MRVGFAGSELAWYTFEALTSFVEVQADGGEAAQKATAMQMTSARKRDASFFACVWVRVAAQRLGWRRTGQGGGAGWGDAAQAGQSGDHRHERG
eukprot:scaffold31355_cov68-Phaeocystis_antarctica.AAC.1